MLMKYMAMNVLMAAGVLLTVPRAPAAETVALVSHETVTVSNKWLVQPAVNPDLPPKAEDWATVEGASPIPWGKIKRKGLSWETAKPEEVHCLWYEQEFQAPSAWQGRRIILDFTAYGGDTIVFVNGKKAGELLSPKYELDITSLMDWQKPNQLRLYFTRNYTGISRGYEQDKFQYAIENATPAIKARPLGLLYPLKLVCRPSQAITDIFMIPNWRQKRLEMEVEVMSDQPVGKAVIAATILDADGKPALSISSPALDIPAGRSVQKISAPWTTFTPWELEAPYLYRAQVVLKREPQTLDMPSPVRFGFREIWTEGNKFMINGHPMRWRQVAPCGADKAGLPGLAFLRLMGYNFMYTPVFSTRARFFQADESWWNLLDEQGIGCTLPITPQTVLLTYKLASDPALLADYDRMVARYLRPYRNHPSILAWYVGINTYCPLANISPQGMGRPPEYDAPQVQFIKAAYGVVKKHDPTRFVYSHADGATADIASANIYLNFVPLQEREDWPMMWAESGKLPYMAAEMGAPIPHVFFQTIGLAFTEYCAIYQGDAAYQKESEAGLKKTIEHGLTYTFNGYNSLWKIDLDKDFPNIREFYRLFVKNTNRAWRTWGVPGGWDYFDFEMPFGLTPGKKKESYIFFYYDSIKEVLTQRPEWATASFDIHREANLTLLTYIAGWQRHTDKTHGFYSGETIRKQVAAVYDGSVERNLAAEWKLENAKGETVAQGKLELHLKPGDISLLPFECRAPAVTDRTALTLRLSVKEEGREIQKDDFPLQVFPTEKPVAAKGGVALYDPLGKSAAELKKLGFAPLPWKPGDSLRDVGLLVIGREVLSPASRIPYTKEDIERGLKVLILEQQPQTWEAMGLRTIETMPRYVYMRDPSHPVCEGLLPEDLVNWRGSPDLLPEGKPARSYDTTHAPKWVNTHAVASVAIQVPETVGFSPILSCEFDSNYSPLLQWRYGKGGICFCSLDITGRMEQDPAATRLAKNLVHWLMRESPAPQRVTCCYWGNASGRQLLERLHVKVEDKISFENPKSTLFVIGSGGDGDRPSEDVLTKFARKGGEVVYLANTVEDLKALGLNIQKRDLVRIAPPAHPLFRGIGPNLLRWRDILPVLALDVGTVKDAVALGDGAFLVQECGKGRKWFIQVTPDLLEGRYKDDKLRQTATNLSVVRLYQLLAQLFTNLGAPVAGEEGARLTVLDMGAEQEILATWQALGPFPVEKDDGDLMLDTKFPGEDSAILGDTNPNLQYLNSAGLNLDWRSTVTADIGNGFVNLDKLGAKGLAVAYVTKVVHSETARTARLKLGADWRLMVWVNGKAVFKTLTGANSPSFVVDIPLKAGDNIISMKIGSGSCGFGFYATLAKPMTAGQTMDAALRSVKFYDTEKNQLDPYQFIYW